MSRKKTTRQERERKHDRAVQKEKKRLRRAMDGGKHIYAEAWRRTHLKEGNYAAADALEEMLPDIREHNKRVGGGTKKRIQDELSHLGRKRLEGEKERAEEHARRLVEGYRRDNPAPSRDASFSEEGEKSVNPMVPAPPAKARRRTPLPPMQIDPGKPPV